MTRTLTALLAANLALAGCTGGDSDGDLDARTEAAAHEALDSHLQAMLEGDWDRVHDLTASDARPNDRSRWLERRTDPDSTFTHKCLGEPDARPDVDLETVAAGDGALVVESRLWEQSDMARLCRWQLTEEATGWRVGDLIAREGTS